MIYIGIDPGKQGGIAYIKDSYIFVKPYSDDTLLDVCWYLTNEMAMRGEICKCVLLCIATDFLNFK